MGIGAVDFGLLAYAYITLPDVRPLIKENPSTTAFIRLRAEEAIEKGQKPRRVQRWVSYRHVSSDLKRAVLVAEDDAFFQHEDRPRLGVDRDRLGERKVHAGRARSQQLAKTCTSAVKEPAAKVRELTSPGGPEAELKRRDSRAVLNVIRWGGHLQREAAAQTSSRAGGGLDPVESACCRARRQSAALGHEPARRRFARQQLILRRMGASHPPGRACARRLRPADDAPASRGQ